MVESGSALSCWCMAIKPLSWSAWCVFGGAERDRFWFVTSGLGLSVQAPVRLVLRTALVVGTTASSMTRSGMEFGPLRRGMEWQGALGSSSASSVAVSSGMSCKPLSWSASVRRRASRSGMNQGEVSRVPLRCVLLCSGRLRQVLPTHGNHLHGRRGCSFDAARWDCPLKGGVS